MINLVAMAQFFTAVCTGIFKQLFVIRLAEGDFLGLVLTYFGIVKINR